MFYETVEPRRKIIVDGATNWDKFFDNVVQTVIKITDIYIDIGVI